MPLPKRGSVVSGRSRDILSQVEAKLKLAVPLPQSVMEATRSSLRVLKIRNPVGSFGKYDNETKRACALLEYDVREYNSSNDDNNKTNVEITMERLAKAAFMKLKDFKEFHEKIGNFRDNLRTTSTTKTQNDGKGKVGGATTKASTTTTTRETPIAFRKSAISSLAIQLGAFVPDSSDVGARAQRLFNNARDLLTKPSKKGGVHGLKDMQRNQFTYEAACFYLVATSGREASVVRRRRKGPKDFDDDRDDNQQLDLPTFLDVTKVSPQFHTVLDYVKELQKEIESSAPRNNSSARPFSSSTVSSSSRGTLTTSKGTKPVSRKRPRTSAKESTTKRSGDRKSDPSNSEEMDTTSFLPCDDDNETMDLFGGNETRQYRERRSRPNSVFEEWKSKVLEEACRAIRRKLHAGTTNGGGTHPPSLGREDILDMAARGILAKHGLIENTRCCDATGAGTCSVAEHICKIQEMESMRTVPRKVQTKESKGMAGLLGGIEG